MVFQADGFLVSFSVFFYSSLPHYEKMMSKPPTDAIAVLHTHHLYLNVKKRRNKHELTVFYLRIIQNPHRIVFKWSRREKKSKRRWKRQQHQKVFIHFLHFFVGYYIIYSMIFVLVWWMVRDITQNENFEPWHAGNFWFWIALRIVERCWYNGASKRYV